MISQATEETPTNREPKAPTGAEVLTDRSTAYRELVSVIIPCYNEERFICKALRSLADQYDEDCLEIIVIDGMSTDRTREAVDEFKRERPDLAVIIIENQQRVIPVGLNLGIKAARGKIIARMDAHAVPSRSYLNRTVEALALDNSGIVGMPCRVLPANNTLTARAIACAVSHPFGIGDAKYRLATGSLPQESVDTVAFASFRKSLWEELGGYNESLLTNEDYDFNYRARKAGYKVILVRAGYCDYFARESLASLRAQYVRYGKWKARMLRIHPGSLKLRHLVAPSFVLSLPVLFLVALIIWPLAFVPLGLEIGLYLLLSVVCAWRIARANDGGVRMFLIMPFVFLTIHLSWGTSFLFSLVRKPS